MKEEPGPGGGANARMRSALAGGGVGAARGALLMLILTEQSVVGSIDLLPRCS